MGTEEVADQSAARLLQTKIRRGLPDGLDLLVICVESGLGLDQALMKVSQELRITHHELSEELQLVNLEMRIGKTRIEALRELARRVGVSASMLSQVENDRTRPSVSTPSTSKSTRRIRRARSAAEKSMEPF